MIKGLGIVLFCFLFNHKTAVFHLALGILADKPVTQVSLFKNFQGVVGIQQSPGELCANQQTEPRSGGSHAAGLARPPRPGHQHTPAP